MDTKICTHNIRRYLILHIDVRMEGENGHACTWHSCSLENNSFMFNNTLIILLSQDNKARFLMK